MPTSSPLPEAPREPLFDSEDTSLRKRLLDSALILALLSAICFALGHLVLIRDAYALGLPYHLLPDAPVQAVATIGGLYLVAAFLFLLLGYLIVLLILRALPASWRRRQAAKLQARYRHHPEIYSLVGFLIVLVTLINFVWQTPNLGKWRWRYHDDQLAAVKQVRLEGQSLEFEPGSLLYLTRRDGLVVFKWKGRKEYVVVREELLLMLQLKQKDD